MAVKELSDFLKDRCQMEEEHAKQMGKSLAKVSFILFEIREAR